MKINVKHVDNNGDGYAIITLDDGSTFGQRLVNLPVDDAETFEEAVREVAADTVERIAPAKKPRDPGVSTKVGVDIPFTARVKPTKEDIEVRVQP